jgi:hypothetical protein
MDALTAAPIPVHISNSSKRSTKMADERKPQDEVQDKEKSPVELTDEQLDKVAGGGGAHYTPVTIDMGKAGGPSPLGQAAVQGARAAGDGATIN